MGSAQTLDDIRGAFVTASEDEDADFHDQFQTAVRSLVTNCGMTVMDAAKKVAEWCVEEGVISDNDAQIED